MAAHLDAERGNLSKASKVRVFAAVFLRALCQHGVAVWVIKAHINARRARNAMACHAKVVECANDRFFDAVHIFFDVVARTLEVNQRLSHHLARAVERDLPTTIGSYNGNIARGQ